MKKYIKFFKSNFTIISFVFYAYGYIYLSIYYYQFDIPIFNYLSAQDILYTIINYLVILFLTYLFVEIVYNIIALILLGFIFNIFWKNRIIKRLGNSERVIKYVNYRNNNFFSKNRKGTTFLLLLLSLFIILHYTNEVTLVFSLFLPFFIIKFYQIISEEETDKKELVKSFGVAMFLVSILCFVYWGYKDGVVAKDTKSDKLIEFSEKDIKYNTNSDSINLIGETSKYLFIYHRIQRKTLIFNKSNISNFRITDTSITKEEMEKQQIEIKKKIDHLFENKLKK